MTCLSCLGSGFVLAHLKSSYTASVYAFRCTCLTGQAKRQVGIPRWSPFLEAQYVPEYIDPLPSDRWIITQFDLGKTQEPEFQRRIKVWGRERFVLVWNQYRAEKKDDRGGQDSGTKTELCPAVVEDLPALCP